MQLQCEPNDGSVLPVQRTGGRFPISVGNFCKQRNVSAWQTLSDIMPRGNVYEYSVNRYKFCHEKTLLNFVFQLSSIDTLTGASVDLDSHQYVV